MKIELNDANNVPAAPVHSHNPLFLVKLELKSEVPIPDSKIAKVKIKDFKPPSHELLSLKTLTYCRISRLNLKFIQTQRKCKSMMSKQINSSSRNTKKHDRIFTNSGSFCRPHNLTLRSNSIKYFMTAVNKSKPLRGSAWIQVWRFMYTHSKSDTIWLGKIGRLQTIYFLTRSSG